MLKKFLAVILAISISIPCATSFCLANCQVDKFEFHTFGTNECGEQYDLIHYLSRDTIDSLCSTNTLFARNTGGKILDWFKRNKKTLTIVGSSIGGVALLGSGIAGIAVTEKGKNYKLGIRTNNEENNFCDNLLNVSKHNNNCGVIVKFQEAVINGMTILSDMNIDSQKE